MHRNGPLPQVIDFQDRLVVHLLIGTTSHVWNLNKHPVTNFPIPLHFPMHLSHA